MFQERSLCLRILDTDPDYLFVELRATNGNFAGATDLYLGNEQITEFAACIDGFPNTPDDTRAYHFGVRGPAVAGGYASLTFRCADRSGRVEIEVEIDGSPWFDRIEHVILTLRVESAGVDEFVRQLRKMHEDKSGEAGLPLSQ